MKHKSPEHSFQVWTVNYLRYNNIFCFAIPNGGRRDAITGAMLKKEGVMSGVADLILLFNGGVCVFVELKSGKNTQQASQKIFQKNVEDMNFKYLLWRNPQDVVDFVRSIKGSFYEKN